MDTGGKTYNAVLCNVLHTFQIQSDIYMYGIGIEQINEMRNNYLSRQS